MSRRSVTSFCRRDVTYRSNWHGFPSVTYTHKHLEGIELLPVLLLGLFAFHVLGVHGDHSPESVHQRAVLPKQIGHLLSRETQTNRSQLGATTVAKKREVYGSRARLDLVEYGVGGGGIEALAELQYTPLAGQAVANVRDAR